MKQDFQFKSKYDVNDLVRIMQFLRGENGCPWDKEQTHESIRKNLIEETYEAVEAIDKKDSHLLCEELGDVLMQVVFHAQMEAEAGVFDFSDVADGVCKKLIERHPHVFGDTEVADATRCLSLGQNQIRFEKPQNGDGQNAFRAAAAARTHARLQGAGKSRQGRF